MARHAHEGHRILFDGCRPQDGPHAHQGRRILESGRMPARPRPARQAQEKENGAQEKSAVRLQRRTPEKPWQEFLLRDRRLHVPQGSQRAHFCTQWVDIQNVKYLKRAPEKRKTYLATISEKILFDNSDYDALEDGVYEFARVCGVPYYEIELTDIQYPDEIEW